MRTIKALLFTLSLLFTVNLYSQVNVWKYEHPNISTGTPANTGKSISTFGTISEIGLSKQTWISIEYIYVWANNWGGGDGTNGFKITVNTTLFENLKISYTQTSDNFPTSPTEETIGPRDFKLQYSTDNITYYDVSGSSVSLTGGIGFGNCTTITDLALPSACDNKSTVYLRWIMTSNSGVGGKTISPAAQS